MRLSAWDWLFQDVISRDIFPMDAMSLCRFVLVPYNLAIIVLKTQPLKFR